MERAFLFFTDLYKFGLYKAGPFKFYSVTLLSTFLFIISINAHALLPVSGNDIVIEGSRQYAMLGNQISGVGDINGDGYPDAVIAAYSTDVINDDGVSVNQGGEAFLYYGSPTGLNTTPVEHFKGDQQSALMGAMVTGDDINGDGYSDLIICAPGYTISGALYGSGACFLYYGSASGINKAAPIIIQQPSGGLAGESFKFITANVNGDAYADIVIGSSLRDTLAGDGVTTIYNVGKVWVFHGSAAGLNLTAPDATIVGTTSDERIGSFLTNAGKTNNDDYDDIVIGTQSKNSYLYLGSAAGLATTVDQTFLLSSVTNAYSMNNATGAGDINNDGFEDLVIGDLGYDAPDGLGGFINNTGGVYIYYGGVTGLNSVTPDVILEFEQANALVGRSIAGAGDVNGDGYSDIIVGSMDYDTIAANGDPLTSVGAAFIFTGSVSGINTTPYEILIGDQSNANFAGYPGMVTGVGDINGDGYSDTMVGVSNYNLIDQNDNPVLVAGVVLVHMGKPDGPDISNFTTANGEAYTRFAKSVANAGDVNGDGYPDVIVGVESYSPPDGSGGYISQAGAAYLFLGSASGLDTGNPIGIMGDHAYANFGYSVAGAGDVNGDGCDDIVIGAPWFSPVDELNQPMLDYLGNSIVYPNGSNMYNNGAAFIYHGCANANGPDVTAPSTTILSTQGGNQFGRPVAPAGDVNGDGYDDVLVVSPYWSNLDVDGWQIDNMGAAILYLGSASGIDQANPVVLMNTQNGNGEDTKAASAGDVNGDGYDDIIIGQPYYELLDANGNFIMLPGAAFLYLGSATGPNPAAPITLLGETDNSLFGNSVATAGDINGDGYVDIVIGAYSQGSIDINGNPVTNTGAAYIYYGNATGIDNASPTRIRGNQSSEYYGEKVSGAGDINGDGFADIYVGVPRHKIDSLGQGAVFAFLGSADGLVTDDYTVIPGVQAGSNFGLTLASTDFNNDGYADAVIGASDYDILNPDSSVLTYNVGAIHAYTAKSGLFSRPFMVDVSGNPLATGETSFNTLNARITAYPHPDGYTKVKLRVEACLPGQAFGDATCVTETSPDWATTTLAGIELGLDIVLREGAYRWRAQVLYTSDIIDQPGYAGPTSPVAFTPWRSSNVLADGTDVYIVIDTNSDGTPDNIVPTIEGTPATTATPGNVYTFAPLGDDYNAGETLIYAISSSSALPEWLSFDTTSGVLSGTPGDADFGTTTGIIISVTDGKSAPVSLPAFDLSVIDPSSPIVLSSVAVDALTGNHKITLICSDNGSGCAGPIYYTTDGTIPTTSSLVYSGPITVTPGTTVLTLAEDNQGNASTIQAAEFISIDTPVSGYIGNVTAISGSVDETYTPVASVTVQVYGDNGTVLISTGGNQYLLPPPAVALPIATTLDHSLDSWSYSKTVPWVNDVEYTVVATATDINGNTSSVSSSFVFFNGAPSLTDLLLTLTSNSILNGASIDATLTFTKLNDPSADLSGIPLILHVTAPDATVTDITGLQTNFAGQVTLEQLGAGGFGISFNQPGAWTLQAEFDNASYPNLASKFSDPETLLVGSSAGYAVLVQGKLPNNEGLASHNKTANRIYNTLKDRGLADQDIHYFNFDINQAGVDGLPVKAEIQSVLEGLAADVTSRPAPVYVIFVDHGGKATETLSARFYIDQEVITPTELDSWLGNLETNMGGAGSQLALDNPRIVIIGACYSGGFIADVAGAGRVIITSATDNEQSYKGPVEDDNIRVGEYFLEELFLKLGAGENLRDAFKAATTKTEAYTKESSGDTSTNSDNEYLDTAVQHPLLEDDADGLATNALFENSSDGQLSKNLVLGINPDSLTNDVFNPANIVSVTASQYLADGDNSADLTLIANDAFQVNQAYVEIRTPQTLLASAVESSTEQLTSDFTRRAFTPPATQGAPYTLTYNDFVQPGKYEIFYYVNDRFTGALSPAKRSIVYKDRPATTADIDPNLLNDAPGAFDLLSPASGTTGLTITGFDWEDAIDPEGDAVSYNFVLADTGTFTSFTQANGDGTCTQTNKPYRQEELTSSSSFVDVQAKLCDLSTYVWKVEAVDAYGKRTASSSVFTYNTNDTNADVGVIVAMVKSATTNQQLTAANIVNNFGEAAAATASVLYNGNYVLFTLNTGVAQTITASIGDYAPKQINLANVTSGNTVELLFNMAPDALLDTDSDGVVDTADNCPTASNASQLDTDGDAKGDACDSDDDADGIPDAYENLYDFLDPLTASDAALDQDGDSISNLDEYRNGTDPSVFNVIPSDVDVDGIDDSVDNCVNDYNPSQLDTDSDNIGNVCDADDDGDGMSDVFEILYGLDPLLDDATGDLDSDGFTNLQEFNNDTDPTAAPGTTTDIDGDGIFDAVDNCPATSNASQLDTDGDGDGDACDIDDDNDAVADVIDAFPLDNSETLDTDGDGTGNNTDTDDDNDGVADGLDAFPLNATESVDTDGDGVGNNADGDDDNDGVADASDAFSLDSTEWLDTDLDGTGNNADLDDDADGVVDTADAFPLDASETLDTDKDGIGDNADPDRDGDGVLNNDDAFPLNAAESVDTDTDGIGNNADSDDDGDGMPDAFELLYSLNPLLNDASADADGDGVTNINEYLGGTNPNVVNGDTIDSDGDGVTDVTDNCPAVVNAAQLDTDGDGAGDACDNDDDNDGVADGSDTFPLDVAEWLDTDGDLIGNNADLDDDGDGVVDAADAFPLDATESVDTDKDGIGNNTDTDDDDDGVVDTSDAFPLDAAESVDTDGDSIGNNADSDDDADGMSDAFEILYGLDPLVNDAGGDPDGDGVTNINEYLGGTNPNVINSDTTDSDGDGITDVTDNCPAIANGAAQDNQLDTDADGAGDACDNDDDNDGVIDVSDAFPLDAAESVDTDKDGIGNNADSDDDADNMPDAFEVLYGLNPLVNDANADPDGDGVINISEYLGGTNPNVINIDTIDSDMDGVADITDNCPAITNATQLDSDGDSVGDACDADDDNDGVIDTSDAFPLDAAESVDTDLDGIGNNADLDDDGDGVVDAVDAFPLDATESIDTDKDGVGNNADTDDDGDGVIDTSDIFPLNAAESVDTDGDGIGNNADSDDDADGMPDTFELLYGLNPLVNDGSGDADGDGISNLDEYLAGTNPVAINIETIDTDADGVADIVDNCPSVMNAGQADSDTDTIGDACDADDDNDGVIDTSDAFPYDATESVDTDGDGTGNNADINDDGDSTVDASDAFPLDASETLDTDNDGIGNNTDTDDDGDGVLDVDDDFPLNLYETTDTDGDGIGNNADADDDGDGMSDVFEILYGLDPLLDDATGDLDGDGFTNLQEFNNGTDPSAAPGTTTDIDGDGVFDAIDNCPAAANATQIDTDVDGEGDACDIDDDGDGVADVIDAFDLDAAETLDTDGDGIGNNTDTDDDGDGAADVSDAFPLNAAESVDTDGDGVGNNADGDDDNDGVADASDAFSLDSTEWLDTDLDGTGNNADLDDDADGVVDTADAFPLDASETLDTDKDGIGDNADPDRDGDGVLNNDDAFPLNATESVDTDTDGIGNNADSDDDGDGMPDAFEALYGLDPLLNDASGDTDSDGISNLDEYLSGTNPNVVNSDTTDSDGDGVTDVTDNCPAVINATQLDTDGDGAGDICDNDDDNDGVADGGDAFPLDTTEWLDTDGDLIGNNADLDDDNDGVADTVDAFPLDAAETIDTDRDGIGDNADTDDDGDGVPDSGDAFDLDPFESVDTDGDGIGNNADDDDDGDGMSDAFEVLYGLDPLADDANGDADGDGVSNLDEYLDGTNPKVVNIDTIDTDFDGVKDIVDNCPIVSNATQLDTDGDGVGDACDADDDNDGVLDGSDLFPLSAAESADFDGDGTGDNADTDDDNDGMSDAFEILYSLNPKNAADAALDPDGDGVTNINEYLGGTNPNVINSDTIDSDGDGVKDYVDNCPAVINASQLDTDGDSVGDACDNDKDNDGVVNSNDAFPLDASESADFDADGIGNNADTDDDNDGMSDAYEILYGLNPFNAADANNDPDGDGANNLQEYQAGTSPKSIDTTVVNTGTTSSSKASGSLDPLWLLALLINLGLLGGRLGFRTGPHYRK